MTAPSWLDHPASHWPTFTALARDEEGLLAYLARHQAQRSLYTFYGYTSTEVEAEALDVLWRAYEWANEKGYPRKLALVFWPMWRSHCANIYRRRKPPIPVDDMTSTDIVREQIPATHATWESEDVDVWLESLPEELRAVARLLSLGFTPEEVQRMLGISSSTYYRRRDRLRTFFPGPGLLSNLP